MSTVTYLKNLVKDIKVASFTPTSSFGVKRVCQKIDFNKDSVIVEYGPGTGVFTTYLLERMTPGSKMILVESNENFVEELKKIDDPRVYIYHESAENVRSILNRSGESEADYVISGIPFSLLKPEVKKKILDDTHAMLKKNGKFLVYQWYNHLESSLKRRFGNVHTEYEVRNIPPLYIYEAVKR